MRKANTPFGRVVTMLGRFDRSPLCRRLARAAADTRRYGLDKSADGIDRHLTQLRRRIVDKAIA